MDMREWLVQIRGDRTQEEVARKAGISRGTYSNIERGLRNPSVSMAKKIAAALGFDWKIFFEDDCPKTKQENAS